MAKQTFMITPFFFHSMIHLDRFGIMISPTFPIKVLLASAPRSLKISDCLGLFGVANIRKKLFVPGGNATEHSCRRK